jgi:uncharacterized protein with von Willebrand factor type A (vWA) domain
MHRQYDYRYGRSNYGRSTFYDDYDYGQWKPPTYCQGFSNYYGKMRGQEDVSAALELDLWSIRNGEQYVDLDADKPAKDRVLRDSESVGFAADMVTVCYSSFPELKPKSRLKTASEATRSAFFNVLMETDEYKTLHKMTRMNKEASLLTCTSLIQQYHHFIDQHGEEPEPKGDGKGKGKGEGEDDSEGDDEAEGEGEQISREQFERELDMQRFIKNAIDEVKETVEALDEAARSYGRGAHVDREMNMIQLQERINKFKYNDKLKEVLKLSGRYRMIAQSCQAAKAISDVGETCDITRGGDIGKIVGSEMFYLAVDEDMFLARMLNRALTIREVKAKEPKGLGPIVISVDESGSMSGTPEYHAKAIALAMFWLAQHQNRWLCLYAFTGGRSYGRYQVFKPGETIDESRVSNWVEDFEGGGSSVDIPVEALPRDWKTMGCPEGVTDVVQITDALCSIPNDSVNRFRSWKKVNQVTMRTIVVLENETHAENIRRDVQVNGITKVSDHVYYSCNNEIESGAAFMNEIFSI